MGWNPTIVWKMSFLFNWMIFRWTMLIFRGAWSSLFVSIIKNININITIMINIFMIIIMAMINIITMVIIVIIAMWWYNDNSYYDVHYCHEARPHVLKLRPVIREVKGPCGSVWYIYLHFIYYKNPPNAGVNIPFVPWIRHGIGEFFVGKLRHFETQTVGPRWRSRNFQDEERPAKYHQNDRPILSACSVLCEKSGEISYKVIFQGPWEATIFIFTWNPKQPVFNGCLVISNHFLCKDWESSNWNNHL